MAAIPHLALLDAAQPHEFQAPAKKINEGKDVSFFLTSKAYGDILGFLLQLNASMFPRQTDDARQPQVWELGSSQIRPGEAVTKVAAMLSSMHAFVDEVPPDPGPRRFGNISFRIWYDLIVARIDALIEPIVEELGSFKETEAKKELVAYLLGSFGSAQRLDYGTGHELSFLAFLGGLWKLGYFGDSQDGQVERAIAVGVVEQYLALVRKLILTYNLEPAGSHGVWGLDDHSFAPYILGSAQLATPIKNATKIPQEGSLSGAPDPGDVAKALAVERYRKLNMYFSAVGFIYDVKKGPFWEHSPMLFDISGVQAGWAKINKGMIKMYIAEVLSKFPVVQHFPFGHLFKWEQDPDAVLTSTTAHSANQPSRSGGSTNKPAPAATTGTAAPWANTTSPAGNLGPGPTGAPWARAAPPNASMPDLAVSRASAPTAGGTRAPWASGATGASNAAHETGAMETTKAPWAKKS